MSETVYRGLAYKEQIKAHVLMIGLQCGVGVVCFFSCDSCNSFQLKLSIQLATKLIYGFKIIHRGLSICQRQNNMVGIVKDQDVNL